MKLNGRAIPIFASGMAAAAALVVAGVAALLITSGANTVIDGGCVQVNGIVVTADNTTIQDTTIRNVREAGIRIEPGVTGTTIRNVTIDNWNCAGTGSQYAAGVACWYCGATRIEGSTFTSARSEGNGIWFKSSNADPSGGGHYIGGNTISGGWDGVGGEEEGATRGGFDRDTVIENNVIQNCDDDGIQVEGGAQNVIVRGNDISGCGAGIAFAAPMTGPLTIERNRIHDLVTGPQGNLFCYKVGNASSAVTYLTANDCRGPGDGIHQTNGGLSPIVSRGNVYQVSRYVFESTEGTRPAGESFDFDCMGTTDPGRFIKWRNGTQYGSLAAFRSATGHEANGIQSQSCPLVGATPSTSPAPTPTSTPTVTSGPTLAPTPSVTRTATPTPAVTRTATPTKTSTPITSCRVRVEINGVQKWLAKPVEFCQ